MERHTKCNNFIHEPAVRNAHLASAAAEPQYNFHTYLEEPARPLCLRARFWLRLGKQRSTAIMLSWTLPLVMGSWYVTAVAV